MYTLKTNLGYSKKTIFFCLLLIGLISLGLKLYTVDFSSLPPNDTFGYTLRAIAHNNGDFTEPPRKTLGWSIFISPFLKFINSDNILDYFNIVRTLSLSVSIISIFPLYLLARRYFDEKYSLVASFLFAIEPHLNHNAGLGLSEPLFIMIIILVMYFILNKNIKFTYLTFLLTGILWWIRFNGIIMLPIISIILFLNFKRSPQLIIHLLIGLAIFFAITSPMLIDRYEQFGDPFYFSQGSTVFTGEFVTIVAENTKNINYSAFDYMKDHGVPEFIEKFIVRGIFNLTDQVIKLSFPYLIVLLPIGILFSFRAFDQDPKYIRANWIVILITLASFVTYFSVVYDRRLVFHMIPFFIIFSIIPIQRFVEYGLSTFSFSQKKKNYSLLIILSFTLILALSFTGRYELTDKIEEYEKIDFSKYLESTYSGKILDSGNALDTLLYVQLTNPPENFKHYLTRNDLDQKGNGKLTVIDLYGKSMEDFIQVAEQYNLKYVAINKKEINTVWYPFLEDVYDNEEKYPYLKKVIDSDQLGFKKFVVKVFEIDYKTFHELNYN